jgi:hypothetical protein
MKVDDERRKTIDPIRKEADLAPTRDGWKRPFLDIAVSSLCIGLPGGKSRYSSREVPLSSKFALS